MPFRNASLQVVGQQERTRAAVLAVTKAEFTERGYAAAKVDEIAEQAELTRGAVFELPEQTRSLCGGAGLHGRACRHG
ncbi:TetR family transcriptional regulator [Streptomyces sp. NBC_01320]|uniref:TetR family transcriptional regulator n=1 Tax=Streptomyces sp. NBC_01320 TaxID=2903824 RepID=UPI003FA35C56